MEIYFELKVGTRLEAFEFRPAREGAPQDVVLVLRPVVKPEGEAK